MKRNALTILSIAILAIVSFVACNKTTTPATTPGTPATTGCNGGNICFKIDGVQEVHDAKWLKISANSTAPARNRLYWSDGTGAALKNLEIDVYSTATGTFNVNNNKPHVQDDGAFEYAFDGKILTGTSGTITVTAIDNTNNTISGTFTITATDGSKTYEIKDGNFVNVPL